MADTDTDTDKDRPRGMSDTRLEAIIAAQIELAKSHDSQNREAPRSKALDYYLGDMDKYVPPEPNRSKVVSRDVADTIGWMLPGVMRVFTASDKMAEAEPVGLEDIPFATEATDAINYVFWKDNKGYEIVYAATWDALLFGNGVVKTWYDDTPVHAISFHSGLTEDQAALLLGDDGIEVLAQKQTETVIDGAPAVLYDLKIKRKTADGRFIVAAIPPEEFLIDADAVATDEAAFTAHWERKTRSELVSMGYDKADVYAIPEAGRQDTPEAAARNLDTESAEAVDRSMELIDYFECYVRVDVDDDDEAELVRACYAGGANGKLLNWEVWEDENPFDDIPCEPIPHRWDARSIADETIDVQDVKTVLTRQMLNNTYWVNNPQRFVSGKVKNPDELTTPTFGGTVYGEQGTTIEDLTVPYIGDKSLAGIGYMDEVVQRRTGVGRQSMALDPEALQNQTAEASRNQRDAAYSQHELVARNMAEFGWKKVFRKLLRLLIKHQTQPRKIMLKGEEKQIDPRFWNADMDVTINVGLGTGSRDRDLMMLRQVLADQLALADRFMGSGAADDAIDMLPKIVQTMVRMAESAGIRNPEDYYPAYTEQKVAALKQMAQQRAAQPDPKVQADMAKAQADVQLQQQKAQADIGLEQARMQAERERAGMELQIRREQIAAEMSLKREQLQAELALKREQLVAELQLKRELGLANTAVKASAATSEVHPGGEPG